MYVCVCIYIYIICISVYIGMIIIIVIIIIIIIIKHMYVCIYIYICVYIYIYIYTLLLVMILWLMIMILYEFASRAGTNTLWWGNPARRVAAGSSHVRVLLLSFQQPTFHKFTRNSRPMTFQQQGLHFTWNIYLCSCVRVNIWNVGGWTNN